MPHPQLFVFGRTPVLSAAELAAVFQQTWGRLPAVTVGRGFLVSSRPVAESRSLIARLGGIVKIGRVAYTGPVLSGVPLAEKLAEVFATAMVGRRRVFGLSFLSGQHRQRVHRLLLEIKAQLAERGVRSRYVEGEEGTLSSAAVEREGLLTDGAEVLIGQAGEQQVLAVTEAVQPFEALSERDYGRPRRDELAGLLPPKLAIAMLNLSQLQPDAALLDPFCGSGTVLQEAELLGLRHLIGTDANPEAISDSRENLRWLLDHSSIDRTQVSLKLKAIPIESLPEFLGPASVDGIVTEPFLGPPLRRSTHPRVISEAVRTTSALYRRFFRVAAQLLKSRGVVVAVVPMFRTGKQSFREPVYDPRPLSPVELIPPTWGFPSSRVVYGRPDQHVFRKIVVYRKG